MISAMLILYILDANADGSALVSSIDTETQSYIIVSSVAGVVVIVAVVVIIILLYQRRKQSRSKTSSIDTEITGISNPNISEFYNQLLP